VLGLILEVEFHALYKDQPLFGAVSDTLRVQGFHFVDMLSTGYLAPRRRSSRLRGRGFLAYADALFLRDLNTLSAGAMEDDTRRLALEKLAFMAIVFHQMEYALLCLDARAHSAARSGAAPAYLTFVDELPTIVASAGGRLPPTFAQLYTYEQSKARFTPTTTTTPRMRQRAVAALERVPAANALYRSWRDTLADGLQLATSVRGALRGYSPVELHLVRHGLYAQANVLRKERVRLGG